MSKIVSSPEGDSKIEIPRSADFHSAAQRLTQYIGCLALTREQKNKLITLVIEQNKAAEIESFKYGLQMGFALLQVHREG